MPAEPQKAMNKPEQKATERFELHVQPNDCIIDHKYSIFENGELVLLANTLPWHKDKPRELVELLNQAAKVEGLVKALEEAGEFLSHLEVNAKHVPTVCNASIIRINIRIALAAFNGGGA